MARRPAPGRTKGKERGPAPVPAPRVEPRAKAQSSAKFQTVYFNQWELRYPNLGKYPFLPRDGRDFQALHRLFKGDWRAYKRVVKAYMANAESFYKGHPVKHLLGGISRFMEDAAQGKGQVSNDKQHDEVPPSDIVPVRTVLHVPGSLADAEDAEDAENALRN